MTTSDPLPLTARCLGCDYLLRGLPEPMCPECGRPFDPGDPSTYDARPLGWRRRRRVRRIVAVTGVIVLAFLTAPRGVMKGTLSFTCPACGERTTYARWEFRPAQWIPIRYPGFGSMSMGPVSSDPYGPPCPHSQCTLKLQFDFRMGTAKSWGTYADGEFPTFNGHIVTLTNGRDVLKHVMQPSSIGIGP